MTTSSCISASAHSKSTHVETTSPSSIGVTYMEQLNLKLKVITDTVNVAEKICQDANKSRLDERTPSTTFHQGQKVLYFQLPTQGTCSKLPPRFNQIFKIISIDPLYQTAQLRESNGAILSKRVHLSVDTTAPYQIILSVQTTVVPNASRKNISIQTPVSTSQAPSVNPGNSSRAHQHQQQQPTVHSVQHKNLISASVGLMPFNPHTSRLLIQVERSYQ